MRRLFTCFPLFLLLLPASAGINGRLEPPHPIAAPGQKVELRLVLSDSGSPLGGKETTLRVEAPGQPPETLAAQTDAEGVARFELPVPETTPPGEVALKVRANGWGTEASLDLLPAQEYARLDAVAARIRLREPLRILFLGDSLTAQRAGRNHVDKLGFWLEKYNPGKVTLRNAAVGGDTIRTVARRMRHLLTPASIKAQHRQETYDGLFDFAPDLVFIFLGQNDTKVTSGSGYREFNIASAVLEQSFDDVLDHLKEKTRARVVLLTSISPMEEAGRRRAQERIAQGRESHLLFGKPEAMERYNQMVAAQATKRGLDLIDVYTPTRNHPAKATLFHKDGLHIVAEGNRFLAAILLEYLAEKGADISPPPVP